MAYVAKADDTSVEVEEKDSYTFDEVRELIGAQTLEPVRLFGSTSKIMLVDEDGQLRHKPVNVAASMLANTVIAGDAFICERKQVL